MCKDETLLNFQKTFHQEYKERTMMKKNWSGMNKNEKSREWYCHKANLKVVKEGWMPFNLFKAQKVEIVLH